MARENKQVPAKTSRGDAPGKRIPLEARLKPHELLDYAEVAQIDGLPVEFAKLGEIEGLLWLPPQLDEDQKSAVMLKAFDAFNAIKPTDATESMLAAQMIGTHAAAMECQRRAMLHNQTGKARDMELKHAQKLMGLYTQQLAALDKHRGKGQQKITVERVTVQSGGQAIVGNIDGGAAASPPEARRRKVAPPQLTAVPLPPDPLDGLRDPLPAIRARTRKRRD